MTTAIISVETVLLVILLVLVAGLLRSHAEILRRLGRTGRGRRPGGADPRRRAAGSPARPPRRPAPALAGPTPGGDAVCARLRRGRRRARPCWPS